MRGAMWQSPQAPGKPRIEVRSASWEILPLPFYGGQSTYLHAHLACRRGLHTGEPAPLKVELLARPPRWSSINTLYPCRC
jgi:hypothetical protein